MKPKSKSQLAEEAAVLAEIAGATSFAAHLRVGPHEKYTTRDIESAAEAFAEAERLASEHSRFGRRGMVFAINARGRETLVTRDLAAQAGLL